MDYAGLRHMEEQDSYYYIRAEITNVPEKYVEQAKQIDRDNYSGSFFVCMECSMETNGICVLEEISGCDLCYSDHRGTTHGFPYVLTDQETEQLIQHLRPDMKEWIREKAAEEAAERKVPIIQYRTLEHSDDFDGEVVCWIEVSGMPQKYVAMAKMMDGENYDDSCFGVCLLIDRNTEKFIAIEDEPGCNLYYIDNDGEKHWFPYTLSDGEVELLVQKVKTEIEPEKKPERAR